MAPDPRPVLAFTGLYVAALTAVALFRGSRELPLYLGLMAVVVPLAWLVHQPPFPRPPVCPNGYFKSPRQKQIPSSQSGIMFV